MKRFLVLSVTLCVFVNSVVFSHEWFGAIGDVKDYKTGDSVPIYVYSTHHLIAGEWIPRPGGFYVLQNNNFTDVKITTIPDQTLNVLSQSFTLPGGAPSLVLLNSLARFSNVTTSGNKEGTKATITALGLTVTKTYISEDWCKIYVNPTSQDVSFAKPLGLPLEIIPITNPADIAAGKSAVFKVLLHGQPLSGATISATYRNYKPNDRDTWAIKDAKTDRTGQITLNIPAAAKDIWIVKTAYSGDVKNNPVYDAESYNSWVSFAVKK
jgi:cobalt/nickel transport protein